MAYHHPQGKVTYSGQEIDSDTDSARNRVIGIQDWRVL